jgi:hypothetical protein
MRADLPELRACLRIQRTRAEKTLVSCKYNFCDHKKGDGGNKDGRPCQAAESIIRVHIRAFRQIGLPCNSQPLF